MRGDEHASAAGVKRGHRVELEPDLARIEGLADRTGRALVLAYDPGSDPLSRVVRAYGRPAGDQVGPLAEENELPEMVLVGFTRVRRRDTLQALPSRWKGLDGGKRGLPAIELGPR